MQFEDWPGGLVSSMNRKLQETLNTDSNMKRKYCKSHHFQWVQISVKIFHRPFGGPCRSKGTSGVCIYFR